MAALTRQSDRRRAEAHAKRAKAGWVLGTEFATVQMDLRPSKCHETRQLTIFDPGY